MGNVICTAIAGFVGFAVGGPAGALVATLGTFAVTTPSEVAPLMTGGRGKVFSDVTLSDDHVCVKVTKYHHPLTWNWVTNFFTDATRALFSPWHAGIKYRGQSLEHHWVVLEFAKATKPDAIVAYVTVVLWNDGNISLKQFRNKQHAINAGIHTDFCDRPYAAMQTYQTGRMRTPSNLQAMLKHHAWYNLETHNCQDLATAVLAWAGKGVLPRIKAAMARAASDPNAGELSEMNPHGLNLAVVGPNNAGKSSFICRLLENQPTGDRRLPTVGRGDTTREATRYYAKLPSGEEFNLYDMPGANVPGRAADTFFKQYYLDAFDAIIIFQAGGLDATTYTLAKELDKAGVPYFFVRNKMDNDVYEHKTDEANQGRLCTWSRAEADMRRTLGQQHRESAKNAGLSAVPPLYFLCSRMASSSSPHPFGPTSFDAGKLMADLAAKLDQASA